MKVTKTKAKASHRDDDIDIGERLLGLIDLSLIGGGWGP